jgi:hypothetical protein
MKIIALLIVAVIAFGSLRTLNAYDWTVHNATSSPIDVKVRLLTCAAHDPKQTIAPGDKYKFHVGGWSIGCCLKDDGLEVNGKVIKHIDYENLLEHNPKTAGIVDAIIAGGLGIAAGASGGGGLAFALVGGGVATGLTWIESKIKWTCGDSHFVVSDDGRGGFIAVQKSKSKADIPAGTYQDSCTKCSVSKGTLRCECNGNKTNLKLDDTKKDQGISNCGGHLQYGNC